MRWPPTFWDEWKQSPVFNGADAKDRAELLHKRVVQHVRDVAIQSNLSDHLN